MKKNGFKRILAGLMTFMMVFTSISVPEVHAEEPVSIEAEAGSVTDSELIAEKGILEQITADDETVNSVADSQEVIEEIIEEVIPETSETSESSDEVSEISDESAMNIAAYALTDETEANNEHDGVTTVSSVYVLDAQDHAAFAAGDKKDGDEEKLGTDNYFTVIYSKSSKVDTSSKKFDDGFSSSLRLNLGGAASTAKNSVKFTTAHKNAVVKVWWVEGGNDNRQMAILDKDGTIVNKTDVTLAQNATCISSFTLAEAGTYYLGGEPKNNYIFKVEVTETVSYVYAEHEYTLDATADLAAFAQGKKADGDVEKAGTDNYFTNIYSTKSKVDSSNKKFEDGYSATQRINFGGAASATKNSVKFTTTSDNAVVKVWWVEGGADNRQMAILDKDGLIVDKTDITIVKNAVAISTLTTKEAGTYYLGGATNNNYIFKVTVTEKKLEAVDGVVETPERIAWTQVTYPVISAAQNKGAVDVTVNTVIGEEGADKVEVKAFNEKGEDIASRTSSKEGNEVTVSIELSDSGKYSFAAYAVRDDEEETHASNEVSVDYILPLAKPSVSSATNTGAGMVDVIWDAVKEAQNYIVYANGKEAAYTDKTSAVLDLSDYMGSVVSLTVKAVRGEDVSSESAKFAVTVKNVTERLWGFSAYGSSVSSSGNGFSGSVNDGLLKVYSTGGKGKIVPNSTDGLAFYYTVIDPDKENFTLEADITVDKWTFSNGQEGFGIMVADTIGKNGDSATLWNNSIQNIASKIEYTVDDCKISMKLGIGTIARLGVTKEDFDSFKSTGAFLGESTPAGFTTETTTLETSCLGLGAGTYNIVGNCTNTPDGTIKELTNFHMSIQRNNTGYIVKYSDEAGNVIGEKLIYDIEREALTQIDKDHIYAGFFASRNAEITVSNVKLTTIDPADDAPAEERVTEYVNPVYTVESASISNSDDYEFVFYSNADGLLDVTYNDGTVVASKVNVKSGNKVFINTKLAGENTYFNVTFTPDKKFEFSEYKKLSNYDAVSFTHKVYARQESFGEGNYIYVAPNANGTGTYDNPASIYEAVNNVKAGQTIVLAGGTYKLSSTVKVERGIDGTKEAPINMVSNPMDSERAVLDFQGKCAGMVLAGDYWYFKGFDVTNSENGQKGVQVSGSHNVLDDLRTYKNGNTGVQISRYMGTDKNDQWPSDNLILNCTSFLNADKGYEDADGFAAKLTIGEGNVFDGCISAFNADDGWDLFAKAETGPIGKVVIKNSVAMMNGYVLSDDGKLINAGNGNGFKMGGESLSGNHTLINSVAFANKAKGIDSNSCPDIKAYNCVSFDNESYNVAFYTNNAVNTNYEAANVVSYNVTNKVAEQLKLKGNQDANKVNNSTNFFVGNNNESVNAEGVKVSADWFVNMDKDAVIADITKEILANTFGYTSGGNDLGVERNAEGTINMNGFLALTDKAPANAGANLTAGGVVTLPDGSVYETGSASKEFSDITRKSSTPKPPYVAPTQPSNKQDEGTSQTPAEEIENTPSESDVPSESAPVVERPGNIGEAPFEDNTVEAPVTETVEEPKAENTENSQEVTSPEQTENLITTEVAEEEAPKAPAPVENKSNAPLVIVMASVLALLAASGLFLLLRKRNLIKK